MAEVVDVTMVDAGDDARSEEADESQPDLADKTDRNEGTEEGEDPDAEDVISPNETSFLTDDNGRDGTAGGAAVIIDLVSPDTSQCELDDDRTSGQRALAPCDETINLAPSKSSQEESTELDADVADGGGDGLGSESARSEDDHEEAKVEEDHDSGPSTTATTQGDELQNFGAQPPKRGLAELVEFPQFAQSPYVDTYSRRVVPTAPDSPKRARTPRGAVAVLEGKQEGPVANSSSDDQISEGEMDDLYESDFDDNSTDGKELTAMELVDDEWPVSSTSPSQSTSVTAVWGSGPSPVEEEAGATAGPRRQSAITETYARQDGPASLPPLPASNVALWQTEFPCPRFDQHISSHGQLQTPEQWLEAFNGRTIAAPDESASLWYCLHGARTSHHGGLNMGKCTSNNREATFFKNEGHAWLDIVLEPLVKNGSIEGYDLHKRCFHRDTPADIDEVIAEVRAFLAVTRSIPITEELPEERWPGYATVMAVAWWLREPIFLISPSGQLLMFHLERYEGGGTRITERVRLYRFSGTEAHRTIATLMKCRWLPTILISSSETDVGSVSTFRLHEWMYPEWSKPDSNRWKPRHRLNAALKELSLYVPPGTVSYRLPKAFPVATRMTLDDSDIELSGESVSSAISVFTDIEKFLLSDAERADLRTDLNPHGRSRSRNAELWRKAEIANTITLDRLNHMPWNVSMLTPSEQVTAIIERSSNCTDTVEAIATLPYPEIAIATAPLRLTRRMGLELIGLGRPAALRKWAGTMETPDQVEAALQWIASDGGPGGLPQRWKQLRAEPVPRGTIRLEEGGSHRRTPLEKDDPWLRAVLSMVVLDPDYGARSLPLRSYQAKELLFQNPQMARDYAGQLIDHVWTLADHLRLGGPLARLSGPPSAEGELRR